jgi:hypothetical protein
VEVGWCAVRTRLSAPARCERASALMEMRDETLTSGVAGRSFAED